MRPTKLTLTGFAGIFAGRKRESITLELPSPDAGLLVALTGPNGAGKSTIMDNLHPYRIMPSRSGGSYSPAAFSFYEELALPEGSKELEWEHHGIRYKSLLQFQSGKRRKTEAYLFVINTEGHAEPATSKDGSVVSDGKTDTYDRVLESILGSPETFFTSVFSAQNRKPLSGYGNAEIKGLMAELLGLDSIKELGKKAGQVSIQLKAELSAQQETLRGVQLAQQQMEQAEQNVFDTENRLKELQEAKLMAYAHLREKEQARADADALMRQSASVRERKASLEKTLRGITERIHTLTAQLTQKHQLKTEACAAQSQALRAEISKLGITRDRATQELQKLQDLQLRGPAIRQAITKTVEIRAKMEALQGDIERKETEAADKRKTSDALQKDIMALSQTQSQIKADGENQARLLKDAERQAALIQEVPCAGNEMAQHCKLLADARRAEQQIQPVTIQLETMRKQFKKAHDAYLSQQAAMQAIVLEDPELQSFKGMLREHQETLKSLQSLAAEGPLLEQAETQIQQWSESMKNAQEAIQEKESLLSQLEQRLANELTDLQKESHLEAENLESEKARIASEVAGIIVPDESTSEIALLAVKEAQNAMDQIENRIANLQQDLINIKAAAQSLALQSGRRTDIEHTVRHLGQEIGFWTTLVKAFGNDGIIALSIDDVGPTLSSYANDLLMACYGPRFTVSIQTQTKTAKGEAREGFDIVVFDADTQEGVSVEKKSGGERVWINEALTRAIALFLAKESGQTYATLFTDEADGALDPDRKRRFMEMKRQVLRIGGYEREYFVSQTPELWEMADAIIDVSSL